MNQWERIVDNVPEPDLFLDLGPGKRDSEAWRVQELWPNAKILGVEACDKRYNGLKSVYPGDLLYAAVDESEGEAEGYIGGRHGMFKFGLEKEVKVNNHRKVSIRTTTVDILCGGHGSVFIWADIEGAELRMLKGATNTLERVLGLNLELFPQSAHKIWPSYTGERCTADQVIACLDEHDIKCIGSLPHPDMVYGDWENKNWFHDFLFVGKNA